MAKPIAKEVEEASNTFNGTPIYLILSCNTVEELSREISERLNYGSLFLHGQVFVFKDQVCQALKSSCDD
ncbi:MAG TPA: hypothetical protein VG347_15915 [Verrucomicrobiae bacterium]|nr:hypothetical protein [Verrucomicrobiae bacterium]